jgi:cupin 2 domain-containing protein
MPLSTINLLTPVASARDAEILENLVVGDGIRIERIVSHGQASPSEFWYDQDMAEWVMVLSGRAGLAIAGETAERLLGPGDAVYLPAHCRHRVVWTDPDRPTVWLAVHIDPALNPAATGPMGGSA